MLLHAVFIVITMVSYIQSYPSYLDEIPNGYNVKYKPCAEDDPVSWLAVGHVQKQASDTDRNKFGERFAYYNNTWTLELCNEDSDLDGVTNGVELGFTCTQSNIDTWADNPTSLTLGTPTGHPGICEPNTGTCVEQNANLTLPVCSTAAGKK